ncbi:hypothetical protein MM239_14900 [Belliella sp. DSM 111904]|uniref:cAMP-binding domain of CRP or a regulatory subunit of cAMP-dependent protein kinases n=1 Tax=Belliella filtrata TaxID=2923435 RepID=A0ABS9V3A5_9BACT|nr:hypothetical protein [Belliella filtrata]MCH7410694.1 hypothetical protein [Belliella filtrata]
MLIIDLSYQLLGDNIKYILDIGIYARRHGLLFRAAFREVFEHAKQVVFLKGEQIKFPYADVPHLIFVHEGAVLGTLSHEQKIVYKSIKLMQSIFLTDPTGYFKKKVDTHEWVAVNKVSLTAIPIDYLMESLKSVDGARDKLSKHIKKVIKSDYSHYQQIHEHDTLSDKLDFLVKTNPFIFHITRKYLAMFMNVSQNGLSKAILTWAIKNFGIQKNEDTN